MKKLIALADVHFSKENQDLAIASLECALDVGKRERIDAWAFAGDLFDRSVANSAASGFPRLVNVIQRMLEIAPILSIEGTVTHDVPGAYSVLCKLQAEHRFINLRPDDAQVVAGILFFGMPEADKEWLLAGEQNLSADESNRKLTESIRSILLSFGALRAAQPELPAVLLFHGSVKGSTLQNRTVTTDGLGREDLQLAGVDYVALGHIHLEQKIDGLEAYYPGPAYHTDWGHLGSCGCNLVTLEGPGLPPKVERIPFPHPRRVKFSLSWPEPAGDEIAGVQAWVCYRATKEEAAKIDTAAILEAYIDQGALPGSRVTVELIATETVRAAEITEKHRLREKVQIYAEASSLVVSESILLKADQLEREAEERGSTAGMHFRLRRMRLRGAVGIWKGQRQDEIDIDLDEYDPGLIALVGVNGAGKSTLIENMHPYTCMLTRDGKLQDHFRLRDSVRELWFTDERTGTEYRALMEIDGANASGSVKYHLFKNGEPMTNGRKEDYEEAIIRMVGSLPLFLRSAFVSQHATKSNPDLCDATKGEKKAIFRELAGLDYIQAYSENAKARAGQLESQVTTGRAQAEILERILEEEPSIESVIAYANNDIEAADVKLADLTTQGKALREKVDTLAALVAEQDAFEKEAAENERVANTKLFQAGAAEEKIETFQSSLDLRETAQENVDYHAHLKEGEGAENARLSDVNKERLRLGNLYTDAIKAHRDHATKLQSSKAKLGTAQASLYGDRKVLQTKIDHAETEIAAKLTDLCPTCGQKLPEAKLEELKKARTAKLVIIDDWKHHGAKLDRELADLMRQLKEAEANIVALLEPEKPALPPADETELKRIRAALAEIDIAKNKATLETAAKAEQEIATLKAQIATLEADAIALSEKAEQLRVKLDPAIKPAHVLAQTQYEEARTAYTVAKEERATAAAKLEAAQKQLAAIEKQKRELDELRSSLAKIEIETAEWHYLSEACGPDGIQALELDAMGPGISEVANHLLSAAYGSRFSIEFRTTRIAGKGSKIKQVEDFAIIVLDNELLTEQPIETLSGGESVWIKYALYSAFAIIRDRSTGLRFLTVFRDEADGALDPESRQHYFAMLEAAHNESGTRHTIIVTHSAEIQEMIMQKIAMVRAS